jgi:hypothetical protein
MPVVSSPIPFRCCRYRGIARASAAPTSTYALCLWWHSAASASAYSSRTPCPANVMKTSAQRSPCGRGLMPHDMPIRAMAPLLSQSDGGCTQQKHCKGSDCYQPFTASNSGQAGTNWPGAGGARSGIEMWCSSGAGKERVVAHKLPSNPCWLVSCHSDCRWSLLPPGLP